MLSSISPRLSLISVIIIENEINDLEVFENFRKSIVVDHLKSVNIINILRWYYTYICHRNCLTGGVLFWQFV